MVFQATPVLKTQLHFNSLIFFIIEFMKPMKSGTIITFHENSCFSCRLITLVFSRNKQNTHFSMFFVNFTDVFSKSAPESSHPNFLRYVTKRRNSAIVTKQSVCLFYLVIIPLSKQHGHQSSGGRDERLVPRYRRTQHQVRKLCKRHKHHLNVQSIYSPVTIFFII